MSPDKYELFRECNIRGDEPIDTGILKIDPGIAKWWVFYAADYHLLGHTVEP